MNANDPAFWTFQFKDLLNLLILIATVFAIVWGPVKAVQIAKKDEQSREKKKRQYEIFYKLMKTRKMILNPERIEALNLIQIEFFDKEKIIKAYKDYVQHLYLEVPKNGDSRFFEQREDLFFELIHEIGLELGFNFDRRELNKFSYAPQGWFNDQNENQLFRKLIIELLAGSRPLHVTQFNFKDQKFPPPPT
jgi:hypothetical protein